MTDKKTAKHHAQNDNNRKIDKIINVLTAEVNTGETDMDIDQIEEYVEDNNHSIGAPSPEQYVHTYLPLLVEESLFGTEEYTSEYESEYELSDEIEPEEQDREEEQTNLPENFWHRVIAIFTVMFILTFIVDDSAVILITFINTILSHYREDFQLFISIPGLKKMTGYNDLMNEVSNYIACSDCHTLRVSSKIFCGNNIHKHSIRNAMIPKRIFIYNLLTASLKKLFMRLSFKKNINQWNRKPKVDGTLFNVYNGKLWKKFVDYEGA
ncbi:hypothetical protein PHYBLDRAFT_65546 [Phycomyces blakesleeanus NRRL 1555(-)]|uniref:Uncharacterized protein n=1 Tax=Phycomyces blakesleeanus (strain ATCC 8743b / DSM 1359 / FGSC 10004 / NBRC 33097 / NRRL 1555) TaxID=763407 RepID=A0A162N9N9_PHYB8|nr:hypothetical protein PHYBLDRAFT_65546 [Phycomyces blakesleeanus NRRL 1555(-)]OAD72408.1 hypothetical protein PHYBLDRAFT_65546 [Phycomyces blakesleeanus NRRL 1555(-)]|eukprot:XP_018290448.1 hypothetical protein PHYBLDRAFT_65546 [Phycomyces blakesleeanus NRRL 1555(-)]